MSKFDLNKMQYVVLPGKFYSDSPFIELQNKVYRFWKNIWKDVFTEVGSPNSLVPDDFLRQDMISAILYDNEVIACHLYTLFNIDQDVTRDHRYFSIFTPDVMEVFKERQAKHLMSIEFLTVHPEWRKTSALGFPFGLAMCEVTTRMIVKINPDAAVAPARKQNKVDEVAYSLGFECLKKNVNRGNLDCDLIALFPKNAKFSKDPLIEQVVTHLWTHRIEVTENLNANISNKDNVHRVEVAA
jgi:hypothetical protein